MHFKRREWVLVLVFFAFGRLGWATQAEEAKATLAVVDKQIETMKSMVERLERETQRAKDANDIPRLNCLIVKLNLAKGLVKACQRAQPILSYALVKPDPETAKLYRGKIDSYFRTARELEKSVYECLDQKVLGEGTTLVYVRPEQETPVESAETSPWDWEYSSGKEGFPAVPPATMYR